MRAGAGFLRGVSSGWFALMVAVAAQLLQVRWARAYLSSAEFALFNIISNLVMAFLVTEIGVRAAFSRLLLDALASGEEASRRLWSTARCVFAAQGLVMALLGLACLPFVPGWFDVPPDLVGTIRAVFTSLSVITALQYATASHQVALLATQRFVLVNALGVAATLVSFFIFWGCLRAGAGIWSYVAASIATLVVGSLGAMVATRRHGISKPWNWSLVSWAEVRRIFLLGIDLFFVGLYSLFLSQSLLLFAGQFMTLAAVGILAVNLKLVQFAVQMCQRVPGTAEMILSRMVAENDLGRFRRTWGLTAKAALLTSMLGAGGLYLWAPVFISWWTSSADVMNGPVLALLVLTPVRYMVHLTFVLPAAMFKAANRLRRALLLEVALYVGLVMICGPRWGLTGVLAVNLGSIVAGSFWPGIRLFAELSGLKISEILRVAWQALLVPLLFFGGLIWWFPSSQDLGWGMRFALTGAWILAVVGWTLARGLTAEEKGMVFRRWRPQPIAVEN